MSEGRIIDWQEAAELLVRAADPENGPLFPGSSGEVLKLIVDEQDPGAGFLLVSEVVPAGELVFPNGNPISGYRHRQREVIGRMPISCHGKSNGRRRPDIRREAVPRRFLCFSCRGEGAILALEAVPIGEPVTVSVDSLEGHINRSRFILEPCCTCGQGGQRLCGTKSQPPTIEDAEILAGFMRRISSERN